MSQSPNKELSQSIFAILAILGLVAIVEFFLLAMMYGGVGSNQMTYQEEPSNVVDRIKPAVTLADIRGGSEMKMVAAPVVAEKSAKELYDGVCMACHANGVAGAPKPGDKAAWESRFANGIDSLVASVVSGKGAMPAKGGSAYSDAEITKIVEYMLIESDLMDAQSVAATAPMEEAPKADTMSKTPPPIAMALAMAKVMTNTNNDIDLAAGEKSYRSACFACHDFGVAGAPKLGDAAAWVGRTNLDALTTSAINGKGSMPPKGGAAFLSDAEVKNIVGFMLSKI